MSDPVERSAAGVGGAEREERASTPFTLRVTCWGTRGSIPSPGPKTARYGGNTSCVEVRTADDRCFIFDAGTGIRGLGRRLSDEPGAVRAELFLSHFHWDHIQGVPFFGPLYDPTTRLRIHAAPQNGIDIRTLFAKQMTPTFFPVPYEALAAQLAYSHLQEKAPWRDRDVEVAAHPMRHPGQTFGYRLRLGRAAIAYLPDNELIGSTYPVGDAWYDELVEFLRDVDILFHDAMLDDAEYRRKEGWGHSTFRQAIDLAEAAGVRRLFCFHHAPERTDDELSAILYELRNDLERRNSPLQLGAAAEGENLFVQETEP